MSPPHCRFSISSLANGIALVSSKAKGSFSAFGVYLNRLGTANELASEAGSNYVLSKTLTTQTKNFNEGQLGMFLEENCATIIPNFSKEYALLTAGFPSHNADSLVRLLCSMVKEPLIREQDIQQCSQIAEFELSKMLKLQPERLLLDWVHFKAFASSSSSSNDNVLSPVGLGNILPMYSQNISRLTPKTIYSYLERVIQPSNLILAAAQVSTDEFQNSFGALPTSQSIIASAKNTNKNQTEIDENPYFGGELTIPNTEPESNEFTRLALAFPGASLASSDFWTFAVMTSLLGGGSAFSSGGPGKGMYSRLYTQVLNRYHWSESAQVFNFNYRNTGLFGIHGACVAGNAGKMLAVFFGQLAGIWHSLSVSELERAKNQAKSAFLMALESRVGQIEYMTRHFEVCKSSSSSSVNSSVLDSFEKACEAVDAVSMEDLKRVCGQLLNSSAKPTVVTMESREGKDSISESLIRSLHSKYRNQIKQQQ